MAWVDVEVSEQERREMGGGGGNWFKFGAIGDKLWGRLDAYEERDSRLNPGQKDHNYTVTQPSGDVVRFTASFDLHTKLQKAMRPVEQGGKGLRPGAGHRICITFTSTQDVGQASPMKVFRLQVDTVPANAANRLAQAEIAKLEQQPRNAQTQQSATAYLDRARTGQQPMQVRDQDILGPADPPQRQAAQARPAAQVQTQQSATAYPSWDDLP